nr:WhiB family transcriptional regulator [Glycomyces sp. YM15]
MGLLIDWTTKALCQEGDPDALFVQGAEQNNAKKVCRGCPVRLECLADALDNRIEFGVWGGMTERERRALLRRHADVRSWRAVFEVALEEEQRSARKGNRRRIPVDVNYLPAGLSKKGTGTAPGRHHRPGAFFMPCGKHCASRTGKTNNAHEVIHRWKKRAWLSLPDM